jgi:hypothetical protein
MAEGASQSQRRKEDVSGAGAGLARGKLGQQGVRAGGEMRPVLFDRADGKNRDQTLGGRRTDLLARRLRPDH